VRDGNAGLLAALRSAQAGDDHGFRLLYWDAQPRLLRYLRVLVAGDAEDVASETWLQIARDLPKFQGDVDAFRGWATRIARRRALDHLRGQRRRPQTSTPVEDLTEVPADEDTAESALEAISTDAALRLIAGLPREQAEAVLLRVVVGLDSKAAGHILDKRAGAVRTATYRGLNSLAARLEHLGVTPAQPPALREAR
jgi:RNA polymerase sigma-70 factor, ECF subfamily